MQLMVVILKEQTLGVGRELPKNTELSVLPIAVGKAFFMLDHTSSTHLPPFFTKTREQENPHTTNH